jgi:photosystem II stability/assembly factor-like uncharacterized protein
MRRWVHLVVFALAVLGILSGVMVWRAVASPDYYSTNVRLSVAAFPDPDHAWVAGDVMGRYNIAGGTIRAATDLGAGWREQAFSTAWSDPSGIAFANARCGWVVGSAAAVGGVLPKDDNMLLATTDGGTTWKRQSCRTDRYVFTGIACANASNAWMVGGDMRSNGVVFTTRDGGVHWARQYATSAGDLWGVCFADPRHGWAVGDGVILATSDGGASWSEHPIKGTSLGDVACCGARNAWVLGSDAKNRDVILVTRDGGATWQMRYCRKNGDPSGRMGLYGIAFADARHGWVVGIHGAILATADGGRTWTPQHSGTECDLRDVAFTDAHQGIVVGNSMHVVDGDWECATLNGSVILRTTDGGATWTK